MLAELPLSGRGAEFDQVLEAVRRGRGIVLAGAPGVGKTRLARDAAKILAEDSSIEWVTATPALATVPFGALAHLMGAADLATEGPDRTRTLLRIAATIADRAGTRPALLVVDDGQWLDDGTAALIHHLVMAGSAKVLLTFRTGERAPNPVLELWKDGEIERLELQPLTLLDLSHLLDEAADRPVDPEATQRLWDLSQGNPLFIRELLLDGLERGAFTGRDGVYRWRAAFRPTGRLAEILQARLRPVTPEGRRAVLDLVALGEPLPLDVVMSLCSAEGVRAVERAELITIGSDDDAVVRLCHPLYGEQLRVDMSAVDRRAWLVRLVQTRGPTARETPASLVRVAVWELESGGPVDADRLIEAARIVLSLYDPNLAERLARRAFDEVGGMKAGRILVDALTWQNRADEAESLLEELSDRPMTPAEEKELALAGCYAATALRGFRPEQAVILQRAERRMTDPGDRAFLSAQRAMVLAFCGEIDRALDLCASLAAGPDELAKLRAVPATVSALGSRGQWEHAAELTERMFEPAVQHRDELPQALNWIGSSRFMALWGSGRYHEADQLLGLVGSVADEAVGYVRSYVAMCRGMVALDRGQPRTAVRLLGTAMEALEIQTSYTTPMVMSLRTEACALAGDAMGARASNEQAEAAAGAAKVYEGLVRRSRAWVALAEGRRAIAVGLAGEAADWAAAHGQVSSALLARHDAMRFGASPAAAESVVELARVNEGPRAGCMGAHALAFLHEDGGALDAAAHAYADIGAVLLAAEAAIHAAEAFDRAGLHARQARSRRLADTLYAACEGAHSPVFDDLVVTDGVATLTRRELEIVRLAATGLSSREIADSLVVSTRTVDGHLYRAYVKLGVTDRRSLPALLTTPKFPTNA